MTAPLHRASDPSPNSARDAATAADRDLLAAPRAAAARRALDAVVPTPAPSRTCAAVERAVIVIEASSLNLDVDHVGEKLHVFAGRVELVDRTGRAIRTIPRNRLTALKIRKRIKTTTLTLRSTDAVITMKGLNPGDAESVRDEVLGLTATPVKASAALHHLDGLAAAGLLDDNALAAKRAQLLRRGEPRANRRPAKGPSRPVTAPRECPPLPPGSQRIR